MVTTTLGAQPKSSADRCAGHPYGFDVHVNVGEVRSISEAAVGRALLSAGHKRKAYQGD